MSENRSNDIQFDQISEGQTAEQGYIITHEVYENFVKYFGDQNPLHTEEDYAQSAGFQGKVMHGNIINGFVSHFIGMILPGKYALLLSLELKYMQPNYLNDHLLIKGVVAQKVESQRVIQLRIDIYNQTRAVTVARGAALVKLLGG